MSHSAGWRTARCLLLCLASFWVVGTTSQCIDVQISTSASDMATIIESSQGTLDKVFCFLGGTSPEGMIYVDDSTHWSSVEFRGVGQNVTVIRWGLEVNLNPAATPSITFRDVTLNVTISASSFVLHAWHASVLFVNVVFAPQVGATNDVVTLRSDEGSPLTSFLMVENVTIYDFHFDDSDMWSFLSIQNAESTLRNVSVTQSTFSQDTFMYFAPFTTTTISIIDSVFDEIVCTPPCIASIDTFSTTQESTFNVTDVLFANIQVVPPTTYQGTPALILYNWGYDSPSSNLAMFYTRVVFVNNIGEQNNFNSLIRQWTLNSMLSITFELCYFENNDVYGIVDLSTIDSCILRNSTVIGTSNPEDSIFAFVKDASSLVVENVFILNVGSVKEGIGFGSVSNSVMCLLASNAGDPPLTLSDTAWQRVDSNNPCSSVCTQYSVEQDVPFEVFPSPATVGRCDYYNGFDNDVPSPCFTSPVGCQQLDTFTSSSSALTIVGTSTTTNTSTTDNDEVVDDDHGGRNALQELILFVCTMFVMLACCVCCCAICLHAHKLRSDREKSAAENYRRASGYEGRESSAGDSVEGRRYSASGYPAHARKASSAVAGSGTPSVGKAPSGEPMAGPSSSPSFAAASSPAFSSVSPGQPGNSTAPFDASASLSVPPHPRPSLPPPRIQTPTGAAGASHHNSPGSSQARQDSRTEFPPVTEDATLRSGASDYGGRRLDTRPSEATAFPSSPMARAESISRSAYRPSSGTDSDATAFASPTSGSGRGSGRGGPEVGAGDATAGGAPRKKSASGAAAPPPPKAKRVISMTIADKDWAEAMKSDAGAVLTTGGTSSSQPGGRGDGRGGDKAGASRSPAVGIEIDTSVEVIDLNGPNVEKVRYVGSGMFGDVFEYKWNHMRVAVKVLTDINDESLQEMVEEAQMLATLRCPYIVAYVGICVNPLAIVTEFMPAGDLSNYLKNASEKGGCETVDLVHHGNMAFDILRGLVYLHSRGVAHRDLKPANVLLTKHRDTKLSDFGLAGNKKKDVSGAGTPRYCAPEVLAGKEGTIESDMYSFGCLLYEIMTLRRPFASVTNVMDRVNNPTVAPADVSLPGTFLVYDELLRDTVTSLWDLRPERRPTASTVLSVLGCLSSEE